MAVHVRQQIRAALVAALTGLPLTGDRVYANRTARIDPAKTPCLVVSTTGETLETLTISEPIYERSIAILVEGYVSGDALDDRLDAVGLEVEQAVAAAGDLDGLVKMPLELTEVRFEFDDTTSPAVGVIRMGYTANTITSSGAPDVVV